MIQDEAQSKTQESDDGFETIHLPFQSDIYDRLKIDEENKQVNGDYKNKYFKLCNLYKDNNGKISSNNVSNGAKIIDNAIIYKKDVNEIIKFRGVKNEDGSLYECVTGVAKIPCNVVKEVEVKEWINTAIKKDEMDQTEANLIRKCVGIREEEIENKVDDGQHGGAQNIKHQLLSQTQLELCTKDTTPSDDWWKDENKYVEVKVADMFINVDDKDTIKTSEDNDTFQDVYMSWTDYIKLTFDNIDGLNTTVGETNFTNILPVGTRVSLKNDDDADIKYAELYGQHSLRIISYDNTDGVGKVTLQVDNPIMKYHGKPMTLDKQKFMELFHSAGGGGRVRDDDTTANADAAVVDYDSDIKKNEYINQNPELIGEELKEEEKQESKEEIKETPQQMYTLITLKDPDSS